VAEPCQHDEQWCAVGFPVGAGRPGMHLETVVKTTKVYCSSGCGAFLWSMEQRLDGRGVTSTNELTGEWKRGDERGRRHRG